MWQSVNTFRGLSNTAPMYTIQVFIAVATNPGITITEIAELVQIAQSSATRTVALLGEKTAHYSKEQSDKDVLGYVELYQDEEDARRTLCRLTKRGEVFWSNLQLVVGSGVPH